MKKKPVQLRMLFLKKEDVRYMGNVKSLAIFENNTQNYKDDGLFSTTIFGKVGTPQRNRIGGYVKLFTKIMHPLVYDRLASLSVLYREILSGESYAIFDKKEKEFVKSDIGNGETGYAFFMQHLKELKLQRNTSRIRDDKITLVEQAVKNDRYFIEYLYITAAGIRDYSVDESGKPSEDEVNNILRQCMMISNSMEIINGNGNNTDNPALNSTRFKLQTVVQRIHSYYLDLNDGKNKFMQNKFMKRAVTLSSRNVITSMDVLDSDLGTDDYITGNSTIIGVYQYLKNVLPLYYYDIRNDFINKLFDFTVSRAKVFDKNTLEPKTIDIPTSSIDSWELDSDLESKLEYLLLTDTFNKPVTSYEDYYFMLVHEDGEEVRLIYSADDITDDMLKKNIRPITYIELFYIIAKSRQDVTYSTITRYPVAGEGGVFPTTYYIKSTNDCRPIKLTDSYGREKYLKEYPILDNDVFNGLSPHPSRLERMKADFDGDQSSTIPLLSDETKLELRNLLNTREYYIATDGTLVYDIGNNIVENVLASMDRDD